jgi:hypothetical protein
MPSSHKLAFAALLPLFVASCSQTIADQACTDIGCQNGLRLTWDQGSWKPGAYTVEATLDGIKVTCEGKLPLAACDSGPTFHCSPSAPLRVGESGCALPEAQHGLSGIDIDAAPAQVRIVVKRDGVEVSAQELTPKYTDSRPNGPQCEPVCHQASATLAFPQ